MTTCPKCGSSDISGPRYETNTIYYVYDNKGRLRYTCRRCGYSDTTRTRDAEPEKTP